MITLVKGSRPVAPKPSTCRSNTGLRAIPVLQRGQKVTTTGTSRAVSLRISCDIRIWMPKARAFSNRE